MSKRAYFGTDGIRGQANRHPMTAEVALRVGLAAAASFAANQLWRVRHRDRADLGERQLRRQ